jgi:hypothetical protein
MNNQYHDAHVIQYWHSRQVGGYKWVGNKSLCNIITCTIKTHSEKAKNFNKQRG